MRGVTRRSLCMQMFGTTSGLNNLVVIMWKSNQSILLFVLSVIRSGCSIPIVVSLDWNTELRR